MNETWWVDPEQLDDQQKEVITLPLEGGHLVIGPPGSGKTNLLLLRANYMVKAGERDFQFIVFTRALREFIISGGAQYGLDGSKVVTSSMWASRLLREYGKKIKLPEEFPEQRLYFIDSIRQLIDEQGLADIYDAIFLDEAQDYLPEEISIFSKLAKVLIAVADSRQKIYAGENPLNLLRSSVANTYTLRHHYRNGLAICKVADRLTKGSAGYDDMAPTSNYDEESRPSSVEVHRLENIEQQAAQIVESIETQLKAYPDELLGVLCPRRSETKAVWNIIKDSSFGNASVLQLGEDHSPFDDTTQVCVSTMHSAKGLEMRALHIAGAEYLKRFAHQRNLAYTAVTRAKTSLEVYHSAPLPGYLDSALQVNDPRPALPGIDDAFKGSN